MAISRKPKAAPETTSAVDVEALIRKGGSVANQSDSEPKRAGEGKPSAVVLRIPADLLERIEQARQARPVLIPRHTWLLEAIVEKLTREEAKIS